DASVRVAKCVRLGRLGRDRLRIVPRTVEAVHATVLKARAPDHGAVTPVRPAAVLMAAPAVVEPRRYDVDGVAAVRPEAQCCLPLLVRPALRPVDPVVGGVDAPKPDRSSSDQQ